MKLYDQKLAPNPRRVRFFMAEKGIECETEQLDIVKGENLSDEFLQINPRGRLPTLVLDNGEMIDESLAICRYFEELHPEPPLMGTDPLSKARIEARQRHMEFDGLIHVGDTFRNSFPGFKKRGIGGNVGQVDAIPALAARGAKMTEKFYRRLDADLAKTQFVAGDQFTIADITAYCTVEFGIQGARISIPEDCTSLNRWFEEIQARPSTQI